MCVITYLFSNHKLLSKQIIQVDGRIDIKQYGNVYLFDNEAIEYHSLENAYDDFRELASSRRFCFIRGNIKPEFRGKKCRRLLHDDNATIEADPIGKNLLMFDFDDVDNPGGVQPSVADLERLVVAQLPAEFHGASFFYQFSSRAGVYGWDPFKVHLFYWTTKPWPDAKLRDWAKGWNEHLGLKWLDDRVFLSSQINYIADPLFVGMDDPLGTDRWGFVQKASASVDLQPIARTSRPAPVWTASLSTIYTPADIQERLEEKLAQIGVGGNYREPLMAAIGFYIAASKRRGQVPDLDHLKSAIHAQAGGALRAGGRGEYLTGRHLDELIGWYDRHLSVVEPTDAEKAAWKIRNDRQNLIKKFNTFTKQQYITGATL